MRELVQTSDDSIFAHGSLDKIMILMMKILWTRCRPTGYRSVIDLYIQRTFRNKAGKLPIPDNNN